MRIKNQLLKEQLTALPTFEFTFVDKQMSNIVIWDIKSHSWCQKIAYFAPIKKTCTVLFFLEIGNDAATSVYS